MGRHAEKQPAYINQGGGRGKKGQGGESEISDDQASQESELWLATRWGGPHGSAISPAAFCAAISCPSFRSARQYARGVQVHLGSRFHRETKRRLSNDHAQARVTPSHRHHRRGDSRFGRRQHRLELLHESRLLP